MGNTFPGADLNQTVQAIDPNLRDARTLMDAIKARTPNHALATEGVPSFSSGS